ncbi:hypothetical protein OC846_006543 [Tilletia horrida]|uniref:Uncharacterized protein n=1 Tax=Tilletia horrida TaxID=155126 RepID=A0AAN6JNX2_9BASI|nr:hypothetical protein OC846_006543 [Tilletia horrida]
MRYHQVHFQTYPKERPHLQWDQGLEHLVKIKTTVATLLSNPAAEIGTFQDLATVKADIDEWKQISHAGYYGEQGAEVIVVWIRTTFSQALRKIKSPR